jgi:hypothetical protein
MDFEKYFIDEGLLFIVANEIPSSSNISYFLLMITRV